MWKILSVALIHQGKDALAELRHAAELLPADSEAHRNLATALRGRRQWAEALLSLHARLNSSPTTPMALQRPPTPCGLSVA